MSRCDDFIYLHTNVNARNSPKTPKSSGMSPYTCKLHQGQHAFTTTHPISHNIFSVCCDKCITPPGDAPSTCSHALQYYPVFKLYIYTLPSDRSFSAI